MATAAPRTTMQVSDILGYTAATLTTAAFVPQAWRTWRTKDVSGVSLRMYSIFTAGIAVWLAYGIVLGEPPMMVSNSLSLVLSCAVLAMKLRYGRRSVRSRPCVVRQPATSKGSSAPTALPRDR